jgi:hypothetical protein
VLTGINKMAKATKTPKFGKKLAQFTPFLKWSVGIEVVGEITRKFENSSNYGIKQNIEVKLFESLEFIDAEGEVHIVPEGGSVNIGSVAGLTTAMTLSIGTKLHIICTGKKELEKGKQPAWEFDVYYE